MSRHRGTCSAQCSGSYDAACLESFYCWLRGPCGCAPAVCAHNFSKLASSWGGSQAIACVWCPTTIEMITPTVSGAAAAPRCGPNGHRCKACIRAFVCARLHVTHVTDARARRQQPILCSMTRRTRGAASLTCRLADTARQHKASRSHSSPPIAPAPRQRGSPPQIILSRSRATRAPRTRGCTCLEVRRTHSHLQRCHVVAAVARGLPTNIHVTLVQVARPHHFNSTSQSHGCTCRQTHWAQRRDWPRRKVMPCGVVLPRTGRRPRDAVDGARDRVGRVRDRDGRAGRRRSRCVPHELGALLHAVRCLI